MRYEDFRREYTAGGLQAEMLDACPMRQFESWLQQAVASELVDATAMILATIDERGLPWQRIVLMKGLNANGFVFYTHYDSDKARAIEANPVVSIHFPWNALDRQVIARGTIRKLPREESIAYFATRPRDSQITAWASQQSRALADRSVLETKVQALREQFGEDEIPMPDCWGGYRVIPECVEFWQGGRDRLHDRFRYHRDNDSDWKISQLQP